LRIPSLRNQLRGGNQPLITMETLQKFAQQDLVLSLLRSISYPKRMQILLLKFLSIKI
jgi:hypothetical protein